MSGNEGCNMIEFRLGMHHAQEWRATETVAAIKRQPGCCDGVWLTMMGYYPPLSKHKEYAEAWARVEGIYREAGLSVSLQVANTIGHGDFPTLDPKLDHVFSRGLRATEEDDPYMVGPDGVKNIGCFCWRSKIFTKYISDAIQIYVKKLHPDCLWIDDDLRAHNHAPAKVGCFCDRCISEFNKRRGSAYTREQLVWEMNYGDIAVRDSYVNFCREGLHDFTRTIAEACRAVSPKTTFGWEYAHSHSFMGRSDDYILGALHDVSGCDVKTRPGGLHYNDKAPWGQFEKAFILSPANSLAPSYVTEKLAEIEDLPGVSFGKSIGGIVNEGTLDLVFGCTGVTLTDLQSCHEPIEYYERIMAALSVARPYWERLSLLSKTAQPGGVCVYLSETPHMRPITEDEPPFSWEKMLRENAIQLLKLGIPVSYHTGHPAAYLLHHDSVDTLTDRDIEFLLSHPVIADGDAVAKLCRRGYASRFALTPEPIGQQNEEVFPAADFSQNREGLFYQENHYASAPMQRYVFRNLDERTAVLGEVRNCPLLEDGRVLGPGTVVTEIAQTSPDEKVKWAVFGYCIWNDLASETKRRQIATALDMITEMPARLDCWAPAVMMPTVDDEGRTLAVTVSSASQSGLEPTALSVRRPVGARISTQTATGRTVGFSVTYANENEINLTLDPLLPYEIVTLFFED